MTYAEVVKEAKEKIAHREVYGNGKVTYKPCETWQRGDQINLWTYYQGYQIKDPEKGVDILLVGQDWGNEELQSDSIQKIQRFIGGENLFCYENTKNATDKMLVSLFRELFCDITNVDPGKRIFFTNYSLGYREGSETGGMTKSLLLQDKELFEKLVLAIHPKVIICLGKLVYEVVTDTTVKGYLKLLKKGEPLCTTYPQDESITVYGVPHPGNRGVQNIGGSEKMLELWRKMNI